MRLKERGIASHCDPLFSIIPMAQALPSLDGFQATIFTSQHSVPVFAQSTNERGIPAYCVGDHTAETARAAGFETVISASGDWQDLRDRIRRDLSPSNGPLLRLSGYDGADLLLDALTDAGFAVDKYRLYRIEEKQALSPETKTLLQEQKLDGVLLYSPKTASRFYRLVAKEGLAAPCRSMTVWCISKNTADALDGLVFRDIRIAATPDENAVLALLD